MRRYGTFKKISYEDVSNEVWVIFNKYVEHLAIPICAIRILSLNVRQVINIVI